MRTPRALYLEKKIVYESEWDECPECGEALRSVYTSGWKTVQTMSEVITIAQRPKRCVNEACPGKDKLLRSVRWQQVAPRWCTYGYDVIAQIGWQRQIQRQTFSEVHLDLQACVRLSEAQVRAMYPCWPVRNGNKWNG